MVNCDGTGEPEGAIGEEATIAKRDIHTIPQDLRGFIGQNRVHATNLLQLQLCGTGLQSVPVAFRHLNNLITLELVDNKLTDLPEELSQLHVKHFSVAGNLLVELPTCFYLGLRHVTDLDISRNELESIETPPLCAARLQSLDLSCNSMTALPSWLSTSCGWLKSLTATCNDALCGVADGAVLHAPLRNLDLTACSVTDLGFLRATRSLVKFCVGNTSTVGAGNWFWDFPEVILQSAASLLELSLQATCLSQVPPNIGMLRWLERLDLRECELQTLPKELGQLVSLHSLLLSNNKLVSLPDSVADLQGLRELLIDGNRIELLPEALGQLWGLVVLDLYDNRLDQWDDGWLDSLSSLEALDVDLNQCPMAASARYEELRGCLRLRLGVNQRSVGTKSGEKSKYDDYDSENCSYSDNLSEDCGSFEMPRCEPGKAESNWGSDNHSVTDSEWTPPEICATDSLQDDYMLWPPPIFPLSRFVRREFDASKEQFMEAPEN